MRLKTKNCANGIKNKKKALMFTVISGIVAGFINGLLGAGGGIIAVLALGRLLGSREEDKHDAFANALLLMLVLSAVSLITYIKGGVLDETGGTILSLAIPALLGGAVGAFLQNRFDVKILKLIFSIVIIYSGIKMII